MRFEEVIKNIIEDQSMVVGVQLAKIQAANSGVVEFGAGGLEEIKVNTENPETVLQKVVDSYGRLFGQASIEVCLNTLRKLPKNDVYHMLPETLRVQLY